MTRCFIKSSGLLYEKLKHLESHYGCVQVTPTQLSTKNCVITLPPFTNARFVLGIKELKNLIEVEEFDLDNEEIKYMVPLKCGLFIKKAVLCVKETIDPLMIDDFSRITINPEIYVFFSLVKNIEAVSFQCEDGVMTIRWDDLYSVEIKFPCTTSFEIFKLRCRDLWFLKDKTEKIDICLTSKFAFFYVNEHKSSSVYRVSYIT